MKKLEQKERIRESINNAPGSVKIRRIRVVSALSKRQNMLLRHALRQLLNIFWLWRQKTAYVLQYVIVV